MEQLRRAVIPYYLLGERFQKKPPISGLLRYATQTNRPTTLLAPLIGTKRTINKAIRAVNSAIMRCESTSKPIPSAALLCLLIDRKDVVEIAIP